jgi:hypothetical protein
MKRTFPIFSFKILTLIGLFFFIVSCDKDEKTDNQTDNKTLKYLSFQDMASMNTGRSAITCSFHGNSIYVCNGYTSGDGFSSEIEKYDLTANSWSIYLDNTIPKRYASSAVVNGKLYIFNGLTNTMELNSKVEVIDLGNGEISYTTDNPNPVEKAGAAVWGKKIYTFGGSYTEGHYSDRLFVFDTETNVWTELAKMPEAKETKGEIIDGKLYVIGGFSGVVSKRIDVYDIQANTWSWLLSLQQNVSAHATAIRENRIWIAGDFSDLTLLAYFDTQEKTFEIVHSNMVGRRHSDAVIIGEKIYVAGGRQNSPNTFLTGLQMANVNNIENVSIEIFEGTWSGAYMAEGDNGTWTVYVDQEGVVTGSATSPVFSETYPLNGNLSDKGEFYATIGTSSVGHFEGKIIGARASGIWMNYITGMSGTWSGNKQ